MKNDNTILAPIYIQLREIIRNEIEEGVYPPGTPIPSENKLAEFYNINRSTVRNAISALVNEGLLKRVQGKGVFVVGDKFESSLDEDLGFILQFTKNKSSFSVNEVKKQPRKAYEYFADLFGIDPQDSIFYIQKAYSTDSEPLIIEDIYIPDTIIPLFSDIDSEIFNLPELLSFYNISISGKRQEIQIIKGNKQIRKDLKIPKNRAIISMETTYQDFSGKNIIFTKQWIRSDRTSFKIDL